MGTNSHYWKDKTNQTNRAIEHNNYIASTYQNEINESIQNTRIYDEDVYFNTITKPEIEVINTDTVDALFRYHGKCCVLNFASYKQPGGGYLSGSTAQEECICHESTLYPILAAQDNNFYSYNRKNLNKAMYNNRAIYSPKVVFEHNGRRKKADVITCASPNFSAASKYHLVSNEENKYYLTKRINFILSIIKQENVDVAILGAFGCGVFGQNPKDVAEIFKSEIYNVFGSSNKTKFVFAIIDNVGNNFNTFKSILEL